jgi:hypothetical protein
VSSRIDSHTKEEASTPKISGEEGEGAREGKGRGFQPVQTYGTSRERMESSEPTPVRPVEESVRPVTPVRPVDVDGQTDDPESPLGFSSSVPMVCDDKSASDPTPEKDEELVDYSSSLEHMNLDINVIHMSMDGYGLSEEDVAHLDFGPKEAIF